MVRFPRLFSGFLIGVFLSISFAVSACDETLLLLLTADNPDSAFSKGIIQLNREITNLGTVLSAREKPKYDQLLKSLMDSWINFSSRFCLNPPEEVEKDEIWYSKFKEIGERIGKIRKLMGNSEELKAHDEVLELSGRLVKLFDNVKMSGMKRTFLLGAEYLNSMEQMRGAGNLDSLRLSVASFSELIATFTPFLSQESRDIFDRVKLSLGTIDTLSRGQARDVSSEISLLLQGIAKDFYDLRLRILSQLWFPGIPIQPAASQTEGEKK